VRLLLDSQIGHAVVMPLRTRGVDVEPLARWQGGFYRTSRDDEILAAAFAEGRVFVTRDLRTVPELTVQWANEGRHHAGVILVDDRSFPQHDVGRLVRALFAIVDSLGSEAWTDRVHYLPRV